MISIQVDTPTGKQYKVAVNGNICQRLVHVFDEIDDIPCQSWIYEKLNDKIVHSTPYFIGSYLGYKWRKLTNEQSI